jgi:hypothetical protein
MAARHNITIDQGATFPLYIIWKDPAGAPINLTGYRIRMQIRQSPSTTVKLLDFDSNTLTAGQSIGALNSTGVIDIKLAPSVTSALSFQNAEWDITATSGAGITTRLVQGKAWVSPAVTR